MKTEKKEISNKKLFYTYSQILPIYNPFYLGTDTIFLVETLLLVVNLTNST